MQKQDEEDMNQKEKNNLIKLLPIGVFVFLYLGLGILFEYILKIEMGFYNIPIVVIFLIALLVACIQNRHMSFDELIDVMASGVGDKNIITMILIFMAAGIFVGVVGRSSAESVAYFLLSIVPANLAVLVLFVVAAFVSLSMGSSVGTITLITPVAIAVSETSEFGMALCVGAVVGGAMFGDNLSFISDTTIAACNGQGCKMKDKFAENIYIALPAAIISAIIFFVKSASTGSNDIIHHDYNLVLIIPYVLVLIGGIIGFNVFLILLVGIITGAVIVLVTGTVMPVDLLGNMGSGVTGMFETSIVAVLVAAIGAIIGKSGGFDALLKLLDRIFKGNKGGQIGVGIMVGFIDIATANNTVAIVMANPIAKEMSRKYDISPKRTASILDTFSCVFQGIIPYGAQMLVALSIVSGLGYKITAFDVMGNLVYPYVLLVVCLIQIILK